MPARRPHAKASPGPAPDEELEALADLADLLLNVGRLVRAQTPAGLDAVPLNETERTVMRVVDLFPGCSPSDIASRARLQRTNVSASLRSLESKGMVTRAATSGRGIAVAPTQLAADNLRALQAAWSRQLAGALGNDLGDVRRCTRLLAKIEERLIEPHG